MKYISNNNNIWRRSTCPRPPNLVHNSKNIESDDIRTTTPYTIDETVCNPTDPDKLKFVVEKHCRSLESYLTQKPMAKHTLEAFKLADKFINNFYSLPAHEYNQNMEVKERNIIMDSGCGTGRSTVLLGKKYPNTVVIGIDRSLVRLNRNAVFRQNSPQINAFNHFRSSEKEDEDTDNDENIISQSIPELPNVLLLRAELADFWRCYLHKSAESLKWKVRTHYLLYPNPYPKVSRLKSRWYAHPSFPVLLHLFGTNDELIIRSNWKEYLSEFAQSTVIAKQFFNRQDHSNNGSAKSDCLVNFGINIDLVMKTRVYGPSKLSAEYLNAPMTNFETKFIDSGEPVFELKVFRGK